MTDDPRVVQQARDIARARLRDAVDVEVFECLAEVRTFAQDGQPAQAGSYEALTASRKLTEGPLYDGSVLNSPTPQGDAGGRRPGVERPFPHLGMGTVRT